MGNITTVDVVNSAIPTVINSKNYDQVYEKKANFNSDIAAYSTFMDYKYLPLTGMTPVSGTHITLSIPNGVYTSGNSTITLGTTIPANMYFTMSNNTLIALKQCSGTVVFHLDLFKFNPTLMAIVVKKNGNVMSTLGVNSPGISSWQTGVYNNVTQITPNTTAANAAGCATVCDSNIDCIGWTYSNNGSDNTCYFKNDLSSTNGPGGMYNTYSMYNYMFNGTYNFSISAGEALSFALSRACTIYNNDSTITLNVQ
jgi:hypothetical protein